MGCKTDCSSLQGTVLREHLLPRGPQATARGPHAQDSIAATKLQAFQRNILLLPVPFTDSRSWHYYVSCHKRLAKPFVFDHARGRYQAPSVEIREMHAAPQQIERAKQFVERAWTGIQSGVFCPATSPAQCPLARVPTAQMDRSDRALLETLQR